MGKFNFYTSITTPNVPDSSIPPPIGKALLDIYNDLRILAQQIDTVITLSEDLRVDSGSRGVILKDNQATPHYWRITISNVGVLIITDIGTSLPV
jgi:hypothetical protein